MTIEKRDQERDQERKDLFRSAEKSVRDSKTSIDEKRLNETLRFVNGTNSKEINPIVCKIPFEFVKVVSSSLLKEVDVVPDLCDLHV